jgi:hypothetical protein
MALIAKNDAPNFEKPAPGMHDAICVFVVDIGTHIYQTQWGEKEQHKIVFCWEIEEKIQNGEYAGKPFMMSQRYTFTLFAKGNLSKMLESWFAKKISDEVRKNGFDLEKLIGRRCTLNLIESDDGRYVNVAQVLPPNSANKLIQACTILPIWINKLIDTSIEKQKEFDQTPQGDMNVTPNEENLPF